MYLLDTDVIIWTLRDSKNAAEKISKLNGNAPISISVITIAEVYKNILPSELTITDEYLTEHLVFDIDQKIAKIAGLYWQQYNKKLKTLSLWDCLIAGTANVHTLTLVTMNRKKFPMRDIQIENLAELK